MYVRVPGVTELSVGRILLEPQLLGQTIDLGGWLIEPGIAASYRF